MTTPQVDPRYLVRLSVHDGQNELIVDASIPAEDFNLPLDDLLSRYFKPAVAAIQFRMREPLSPSEDR